jgi:hypothetical protein
VGLNVGRAVVRLTDLSAKSAKPGRHTDGDGLTLVVSNTGAKKWVLRYQAAGVRRDKGLGSYPAVGLKEARAKAAEDRRLLAAGQDPIAARRIAEKGEKPIPTFGEVAAVVIADAHEKSINAKVRYRAS